MYEKLQKFALLLSSISTISGKIQHPLSRSDTLLETEISLIDIVLFTNWELKKRTKVDSQVKPSIMVGIMHKIFEEDSLEDGSNGEILSFVQTTASKSRARMSFNGRSKKAKNP